MDLQLIAIAIAVVIIAVILLACFISATRERTFEDALAQQQGLGILLSNKQQAGKSVAHKDKHKQEGGGAKKKAHSSKQADSNVASSGGQIAQKKENATEEKQEKPSPRSKSQAVGSDGSESPRRRQSSHSEASGMNLEESRKKQKRDSVQENKEIAETDEVNALEQKRPTKKTGKKQRRTDLEEPDAATLANGDHKELAREETDVKPIIPETDVSSPIPVTSAEPTADSHPQTKKSHKKKNKTAGGKQQEYPDQEDKENVAAGDNQLQKIVPPATASAISPKEQKTEIVSDSNADNVEEYSVEAVIEKLKASPLSHVQLESVLDALLTKQDTKSQNTKKDDHLSVLKKQLEEKEKALAQETQLVASVNQKVKELRQQLETEKNRSLASERTYVDQLNGKQRELQSAQQKVQELNGQCAQMSAQGRRAQEQLISYQKLLEQAPNPTQMQQLREENQRLKERIARNEQESHAFGADIQRLRQELAQRDGQLHQAEQRFVHLQQTLSMQENSQAQQAADYKQKLTAKDVAYAQLEQELATVRREWALVETSVRELRNQASSPSQLTVERNISLQNAGQNEHVQDPGEEKTNDALNRELVNSKSLVTSLEKRLADLDKELKESQATLKRQGDQYQKDALLLRDQLEDAKRQRANLEKGHTAEIARLQELAKVPKERIEKLEKMETAARDQLAAENKARLSAEAQVAKLLEERDSSVKTAASQALSGSSGAAVKKLEAELEKMKQDRLNLEQKVQSLVQENRKLTEQANSASTNGHSEGASSDALKIQELSLTHLNKQLIAKDGEIAQMRQQLDQQRQKNSELRERNQKVVEAMNQLEKTSKDVMQKLETHYQKQLDEQEKLTKSTLSKYIPNTKIPEKSTFPDSTKEVQRIVTDTTKSPKVTIGASAAAPKTVSKEEEKLKRENLDMRTELARYQQALKQTEIVLEAIEDTAARHEQVWRERVCSLENELEKIRGGHDVDLSSASLTSLKKLEETKSQIASLRSSLETIEKERSTYKSELDQLRMDIENERNGARDLSSQVVKLRGMLKTGQDALKQEQDLVSHLQNQLKAFQASASTTANDAKEGNSDQLLHDELNALRTKLAHCEQQLEREMSINKQLNNKLASLGVSSVPAAIVGNSNGSL